MSDHLLGDRANQDPRKPGTAMGTDHDQVDVVFGRVDDRGPRHAAQQARDHPLGAQRICLPHGVIKAALRVITQLLHDIGRQRELPSDRDGRQVPRMNEDELRVALDHEPNGRPHRLLRSRGEVDRTQDLSEGHALPAATCCPMAPAGE
ncbi:MAG: hypothetical protein ABIY55_22570 [Kofleriaceae bacterium]